MTVLRPRAPIFSLSYALEGGESENYNSYKSKVEIGRGSKDFPVDLKLEGDQEISRKQAIIERLDTGKYKVECVGRNSIEIDGIELDPGQHVDVTLEQSIRIGVYQIRIKEVASENR